MAAQFAELDEKLMSFENDYNAIVYDRDFRLDELDLIKVINKHYDNFQLF